MTEIATGAGGIVVSGQALASEAGSAVLRDGGNAVDAAVAAALVLSVVSPYATSLGGDVYILIHDAETARVHGINGTGSAPARATAAAFGGDIPPTGIASVSVPGFVAGLAAALERFGTRDLAALIEPAHLHAADGFLVHATLARNIAGRRDLLVQNDAAAALFLPGDNPLAPGAILRQPDLAGVLAQIADGGAGAFYEGETAHLIAADSAALGGLLTTGDLAAHTSIWQAPIAAPFYECDVATMPPNSYGLTLLLQLIALKADGIERVDPSGAPFVERGLAARRAAYRAATGLIGDPAGLEARARDLLKRAIREGRLETIGDGAATEARDTDTTNVVAMDDRGNAVSLIQSISAPFGSGVVARGTGIVLNNRMRGFVTDPASPNCVGPGKRPAHTLSPCLVLKNGRPWMSIGTPGAAGQTGTLAQFLARALARGQPIAKAIAAPRWSVDLKGAPIVEESLPAARLATLQESVPDLRTMPRGWQTFGSLKVAVADEGRFTGYADDRREAAAVAC